MASKFGLAGGIPERKVRPIWDAIDSRQFKSALKHVTTLLAKHPNSPYALALKGLVLERMGKPDEALSVSLNAKELLYSNDSLLMDDLTLSTLQIVFQRLDHLDLATDCYEHACGKFPNNLELMMGLFNCYVREYSFVKQQQTAIKMYKLVGEERFLLWAVCSIQLQVLCGNGGDKLLVLAEGLLKKHVASHSLHEPEALMVYISILERQAKFGDALEILSGKLGSLLMIEVDKLRMQGRLLAQAGDYTAAADIFHKILESCPDDWECFLHYLGCLLEDDSIWCDETVNDPVHPPKFVNCKVSHLTDEQFDSRLSIASAFIQKLKADTVDNFIRCPYLATIEIERRKHLRGKGNDDNLMDGIVQYFCRFGHLACFTSDVEMFVEVFTTDKKAELLEKLMENDTLSTAATKTLGLSISLFKIKQLLLGDMFESSASDLEVSCVQMFEMYCKNLPLSKDLDPQESMHGEELLSLTCNILVQLFWRTKNVGYLVEAIMVLEFGLAIRRHVSQYKILLLHLYCHFGALSVAHEGYKSLDVKNMLMESLLHHILPQMLVSPLWTELNSLLKDYLKFMDNHFRESADLTCLAYCYRNYSKGILQSVRCGIHFRELSNRIASLTFSEDLQPRPWWTPTLENNYLLGPSEGIFYCPREILTKERETSLKRVRGAVLVVGRWGLVVDNLGLTQFDNTTWVQDKGGQHPRNGSPTDTKWVTKFSLTSKKDTRAEVKVQKMSQPFTQMSQAQIYFINWDHGIFDGQENGSLVSYMNSEVHGAVKEKREWLTRKAKVVLELLFVNKTSILHHCLLTASGIGEREALLRGINRAAMTLCFLAKNVTKNRAFDLRGNSSVIHIAWSLGFKLWDPGGSCFQLLQDPCSIRARQLLMQWKESMVEEAT